MAMLRKLIESKNEKCLDEHFVSDGPVHKGTQIRGQLLVFGGLISLTDYDPNRIILDLLIKEYMDMT